MMRSISIDTGVQHDLSRLGAKADGRCRLGVLLVRKVANGSRAFVLKAVPFKPAEEEDDDDSHLGWGTISDVPRRAVEAQAQAMARMLVGGIRVGGIYAVSRELGKAAVEALCRLWPTPGGVLVHVSSESSLFTVRAVADAGAVSGGGKRSGAAAAGGGGGGGGGGLGEVALVDVKYQSVASKLIAYHCMVDVALEFGAPCSTTKKTSSPAGEGGREKGGNGATIAALQAEEDAFFRAFLKSTKAEEALLEHAVCFPAVGEDGGEEGRFTKIGPNLARVVEVYTPAFIASCGAGHQKPPTGGGGGSSRGGSVRPVQVYGSIGCVACIHEKESDQDGVAALKEDCIRSLRDRVHILREEAAAELEDKGGATNCLVDPAALAHAVHAPDGGALRLPRRVLLPLDPASSSSMLLAEYLLPGEEVGEAVARVQDALSLPSGVVKEAAVVFPELEAAVGQGNDGQPHRHHHPHGGEMGRAPSLGRISSCNSLSMGRAPSTSSLLLGHLERAHSSGSMASMPRVGSMEGLEGEERPVTMDAEEEEEEGDFEAYEVGKRANGVPTTDGPEKGTSRFAMKEATLAPTASTSTTQLMICSLVVGLAMVIGAALLRELQAGERGGRA